MKESKYRYRGEMLLTSSEKDFSQTIKVEIMHLFGRLMPEQKEEAAQKAIPIVEQAKTEKAAYNKIAELIEKMI